MIKGPNKADGMSHPYQSYTWRKEPGQTVYVFGAGASAAEGTLVPTNSNLLSKTLDDFAVDSRIRRNVADFLEHVYGPQALGVRRQPTFEEAFTFVELALSEERYFRGWSRQKLSKLRDDMIIATGALLERHLPRPAAIHEAFVKNLFQIKGVTRKNTAFISFNYDIALDEAIIKDRKRAGDLDYGIYARSFDVAYVEKKRRWDPPNPKKSLLLMKPHGSFNWTWCPTCGFVVMFPEAYEGTRALFATKGPRCYRCRGRLRPLVVPPAWAKSYRNPVMTNIWQISEFLLSQAKLLVFVGYSLPDADFQFKFMLRRALARKDRPVVVIVSDHKQKGNDTYKRYSHFFGDVTWDSKGFRHFAGNPLHGTKSEAP